MGEKLGPPKPTHLGHNHRGVIWVSCRQLVLTNPLPFPWPGQEHTAPHASAAPFQPEWHPHTRPNTAPHN